MSHTKDFEEFLLRLNPVWLIKLLQVKHYNLLMLNSTVSRSSLYETQKCVFEIKMLVMIADRTNMILLD